MGKNFTLNGRTILSSLPKAGFTHLQFTCSQCGKLRRKPLSDFNWIQGMGTIASTEAKARCDVCGGPPLPGTFGPWSKTNFYRGPR